MSERELYKLSNIRHYYNSNFKLDIPELTIDDGISMGFIGPNGSGKSTLFRILSFLEAPSSGKVMYTGRQGRIEDTFLRNDITMLLQEPYLLKRTVFENVLYGLKARGEKADSKDRIYEALTWVGLDPPKFANRRWFELSGGEAKRVAIASRLVLRPRVLILDEPTSNIDHESDMLIKEAINRVRTLYNTTLIISSHDHLWLNQVADDILRIHDGRIIGSKIENLIQGPWQRDEDDLWSKKLSSAEKIYATKPPKDDSIALLSPADIIIAEEKQSRISALNILKGRIRTMSSAKEAGLVKVHVDLTGLTVACNVTQHTVHELRLVPGKEVWAIFKASSLHWQ